MILNQGYNPIIIATKLDKIKKLIAESTDLQKYKLVGSVYFLISIGHNNSNDYNTYSINLAINRHNYYIIRY